MESCDEPPQYRRSAPKTCNVIVVGAATASGKLIADDPNAATVRATAYLPPGLQWFNRGTMVPDVRICADVNELSLRAAEATVDTIAASVRRHGRCSLALSGGNTPRALYALLASRCRERIPWTDVHVFWGDERYVSTDDPESNYRMALETLLAHVPCPAGNIHPMPVSIVPSDAAAREYECTLRTYFSDGRPRFDLVLLGLGEEGHTASLFAGSPALSELRRWVVAANVAAKPPVRLTLTLPVLIQAATIYVLVAGSRKAQALGDVLTGKPDPSSYPAAGLLSAQGTLTWWADADAAAHLHRAHRTD
jgi:6-phosphogluconolactonase